MRVATLRPVQQPRPPICAGVGASADSIVWRPVLVCSRMTFAMVVALVAPGATECTIIGPISSPIAFEGDLTEWLSRLENLGTDRRPNPYHDPEPG